MLASDDSNRSGSKNARQIAYQALKSKILNLQLFPGAKLSEAELAELLDMSRTPVRDVLARLTRENLVELIPQRGAFVSLLNPARIKQSVWLCIQTGIAVLDALYVERVSVRDFLLLHHIVTQMHNAVERRDFAGAAIEMTEFHRSMYRLAGLTLAWETLQSVTYDFQRVVRLADDNQELWDGILLECRSIADSLSQRNNAQAVHALRHQYNRINDITELMRLQNPNCFVGT